MNKTKCRFIDISQLIPLTTKLVQRGQTLKLIAEGSVSLISNGSDLCDQIRNENEKDNELEKVVKEYPEAQVCASGDLGEAYRYSGNSLSAPYQLYKIVPIKKGCRKN